MSGRSSPSPSPERTFIMVKPDGVQRGLVGEIIKRFEQKGYKLVALKFMQVRPAEITATSLNYTLISSSPPWNYSRSTMLN